MQADALSHFSKDHVSNREDNHQVQVLGPKHFRIAAVMHYTPIADVLAERIKKASKREAEVIEGLKSIDKTAPQASPMVWPDGKRKMGSFITVETLCP
jgi:hypothetical protein